MPLLSSPRLLKFAAAALGVAVLGYLIFLAVLYFSQERLIFPGTRLPADFKFEFGPQQFTEMRIDVPGATLDALHFTQANPRGLVFFIHGNAGNLETWTTGIDFYRRVNYDLFIFDYRGYGKSTGRIESEGQLNADVRAAWDASAPRYTGKPIVIYGRSLGTGLATTLAAAVEPRLLVLVSPYSSLAAAARSQYPIAPEWLLRYPLRTDRVIGSVKSPILLVHGTEDRLIPAANSERLRSLTQPPADLLLIQGAGHNNIHEFPAYLDGLAIRLIAAADR